jgi:hypothetical protein
MKCWNCEKEEHRAWDCSNNLKQSVRIRMKKVQQRKLEREEKKKDSSSKSGKKHFMYGLVDKTYIENQQLHPLFNLKILWTPLW